MSACDYVFILDNLQEHGCKNPAEWVTQYPTNHTGMGVGTRYQYRCADHVHETQPARTGERITS